MAAIKKAFNNLVCEVVDAIHRVLQSRRVQTHALAFGFGMVVAIVSLRCMTAPVVEAAEPAPVAVAAEAPAEDPAQDADAERVARVLYGVRDYGLSESAKTAIIEVIKNRVADTACEFRSIESIEAACEQANQWQGYVSDGPYLREDYDLALRVLNDTTGARTIPEGCFFLVVKQGEVIARTKWDGGNEWRVN